MKIDEAIRRIKEHMIIHKMNEPQAILITEALCMAIEALSSIEQIKWERDIAIKQLEEIGVGFGEKIDDVKEAVDKSNPMKVRKTGYYTFCCPVCGKGVGWEIPNYCERCGQRLEY